MSDLSRLLEDVYGDGGAAPPAIPEWSSDEALDDTFASWVPGPPADAPAAERAFSGEDSPVRERPTYDDVFAAFGPDDASALTDDPGADVLLEAAPAAIADVSDRNDLLGVGDLAGSTAPFAPETEPTVIAPPVIARWTASDDDILPAKGSKTRRGAPAKPVATSSSPSKARFQLSRKAAAPLAPPVALDERVEDHEPETAPVPAELPVAPEVGSRRSFRRPAPKHAKPKAGLQLTRRGSGDAPADAGASAAEAPAKRRSFRLR